MFRNLRSAVLAMAVFALPSTAFAQTIEVLGGTFIQGLLDASVQGFEASNPGIDVQVTTGPRSDDDLLQDLLRRSSVGVPLPDVVVTGSGLRLLSEREIAVNLTSALTGRSDAELATASAAVLEKGRVGDQTFGAGFGLSMQVVLFNADLVTKAGGDPRNLPTDWPGILDLAREINKLGSPIIGGFIEADNTGSLSLLSLLQSHGGSFMDAKEQELTLNTPQGLAALNVLRGFGEAGQADAVMTRDQARQAFGAGTIGVFVTMSSTIARHEKAASGRFTITSVPLPVTGDGSIPTAGPVALVLTKDPEKQRAAIKYVEFLVGPEGQAVLLKNSGYLPVNEQAITQSSELQTLLAAQPNYAAIISRLPVAVGWFEPPGDNPARIATIVNEHLFDVVTLKKEPGAALETLSEAIKPLLPTQ